MKNEELTLETTEDKGQEMINTDEFIPDYSFQYKIRQLNVKLDVDAENYGFCLEP